MAVRSRYPLPFVVLAPALVILVGVLAAVAIAQLGVRRGAAKKRARPSSVVVSPSPRLKSSLARALTDLP